jgi:hypothetical protein
MDARVKPAHDGSGERLRLGCMGFIAFPDGEPFPLRLGTLQGLIQLR